jgi:hypothetical protein
MWKNHRIIFDDEQEKIIKSLNFEEYYGKTLQVLIVKGSVYHGLRIYLSDTLRGVSHLGYGKPPTITACLLLEKVLTDKRLQGFRYIVPTHDEVSDTSGTLCNLCIQNDAGASNIGIYYDEPIPGNFANKDDAYVFTALHNTPLSALR